MERQLTESKSPYERGAEKIAEVYAGEVVAMPEGTMAFNDIMLKTLFAEVWDRDVLNIKERRLLIMGVIAANGALDTWKIQAKAALENEELTADQLRETLIMLAPYAGYPNVAPFVAECEAIIYAFENKEAEPQA